MHKKITYMVMGAAVGIILIGSVFAIDTVRIKTTFSK